MKQVLCPKCLGQRIQSRPPWLPHDVDTWGATSIVSYPCVLCDGTGIATADRSGIWFGTEKEHADA